MPGTELTIRPFFWRATRLFPEKEIVARTNDGIHRYTYGEFGQRVPALAAALDAVGVEPGDRVGTLGWNTHRHFEAYFAIPLMGAQLHTINVQLPDEQIEYIVNDAGDDVLLVDPSMRDTVADRWDRLDSVEDVIVMGDGASDMAIEARSYESLVAANRHATFEWPALDEDQPAGMCYTSGTTGRPKGVEYTHKMYYAHALMVATPAALDIAEPDVVLPLVPMFHVNSWEFPYAATFSGSKQVFPGPSPSPGDIVRLIEEEAVTLSAGVPTVWIDVLDYLDDHGGHLDSLERIVVGGSAAPVEMMRRYEDEYGVRTDHAWGMTETMSIGSVSRPKSWMDDWDRNARYGKRKKQGLLSPGLEMRVVGEDGQEVPWDGDGYGELYVRGPTVARGYRNDATADEAEFEGSWLRTGDIVAVDDDGYLEVVDRAKDVIKSGGEWISSIELENALMAHDRVVEAAVIAVPHDRWGERPIACVVVKGHPHPSRAELRAYLESEYDYPDWWLPDDIRFVEAVPKTATGKFDKQELRDQIGAVELEWTPRRGA